MLFTAVSLLAATGTSSLDTIYFWLLFAVAIVTIVGGTGGLWQIVKWFKRQSIRDDKLDQVIVVALGDPTANPPIPSKFDTIAFQLDDIKLKQSPNGLNTNNIGDMVKRTELSTARTEKTVAALQSTLDQHLGQDAAEKTMIWKELDKKQEKESV